ncbi:glycosyltransferase [Belnapia rosea]|uniref:Glycosyltransferase, GT2 family n=1 Tax=Belnapia rosea TaxID=938405 RepID=A0A1G7EC25_9PROT|nr:glycosyltransferase [Belnapia rosea]SDE61212.1 Glycosyltransferase, GT2 family [Belnapia rosea]
MKSEDMPYVGEIDSARNKEKLSAVVISYNRADLIGTCLRALSFADELIVIDKSSTDGTPELAAALADRVIVTAWSPTVEETRAFAVSNVQHEWILCLDDDECLSVEAVRFIQEEMPNPRADVYALPQRHYILGVHDEAAYYWPEYQPRLFRRGAVIFRDTIHGGTVAAPNATVYHIPPETGACIHHLSHKNVAQWIEKSNRYTSRPDRLRAEDARYDLAAFAHGRIDAFIAATKAADRGTYPAAVAVLRAVYDIIDRLKAWEAEEGLDGGAAFKRICRELEAGYERNLPGRTPSGPVEQRFVRAEGKVAPPLLPSGSATTADVAVEQTVTALRDSLRHVRVTFEAYQRRTDEMIVGQRAELEFRSRELQAAQARSEELLAETERVHAALAAMRAETLEAQEATRQAQRAAQEAMRQAQRAAQAETERVHAAFAAMRAETLQAQETLRQEQRAALESAAKQEATINVLRHRTEVAEAMLRDVLSSTSWVFTAPLRFASARARLLTRAALPGGGEARRVIKGSLLRRLGIRQHGPAALITAAGSQAVRSVPLAPHEAAVASYVAWRSRFDTPSAADLHRLRDTAESTPPALFLISVTPDGIHLLDRTLAGLRVIVGLRWSATILFAEGCSAAAIEACGCATAGDPRFITQDRATSFDEVVLLLEAGAIPRSYGPRLLVDALERDSAAGLAYSDEDRLVQDGIPDTPFFKPRFARSLADAGVLLGRMTALRPPPGGVAVLIRELREAGSAQALARVVALGRADYEVVHVPHVTFHDTAPPVSWLRVKPSLPDELPLVSIIIPTRDSWRLLKACLASLKTTAWPGDRLEIIVVDNNSSDEETLAELAKAEAAGDIRLIRDAEPFNYPRLNNVAAQLANGELLVLLNNDTEVRDPQWLRKMAAYALRPGAGAVGPKLLYGDGTVQHGGVILGVQGAAAHAHRLLAENEPGYAGLATATHEVSAVTGACLMVRRDLFFEVGGLREEFRVAFNDVLLCLDLQARGCQNYYLGEPLMLHHESKTRGYDDTPEKVRLARHETCMALRIHPRLFRDDPFYSPNLSLEIPHQLAFAPRRRAAWKAPLGQTLRVMMLSITYARGHGVAVVIEQQVRALAAAGHEVILAGARSERDFDGSEIIEVHDPRSAATLASDLGIDVIVAHTPPYFGVARWTGAYPPVLSYDYGEPPPEFFPDAAERRIQLEIKAMELAIATRVLAISEAVANESTFRPHGIVPLGNSHLGCWDAAAAGRRVAVRAARGWTDRTVVLNVCRFHAGERAYKGVDTYAAVRDALVRIDPIAAGGLLFVLCGKGTPEDVAAMEARGLTVIANVTDAEMTDLYAAADVYANFSRWEGYNLGIGQALAMGLPVVASDIPAHRAFGVKTTDDPDDAARFVLGKGWDDKERTPCLWMWDEPLRAFVREVEELARATSASPAPRFHAPATRREPELSDYQCADWQREDREINPPC